MKKEEKYPTLMFLSMMLNMLDDEFNKDKKGESILTFMMDKEQKEIINGIKNMTKGGEIDYTLLEKPRH